MDPLAVVERPLPLARVRVTGPSPAAASCARTINVADVIPAIARAATGSFFMVRVRAGEIRNAKPRA
jgi:hypothetical protein